MTKNIKNIRVIINPCSGKGEPVLSVINASMKEAGIEWEASITHKTNDATRLARAAAGEAIDALAVYGGDGTVMEALSGLLGSKVPLMILPGGSANVMANELGIPKNLKEACSLLGQGRLEEKAIDLGQFNDRYFMTGISIGFSADLVKEADRESKNKFGILAYFLATAEALKKLRPSCYRLNIDGKEHEVRGLTCIIANAGNLGFTKVSLDKHIDVSDGLLDIVVVRKANFGLLKLLMATLIKRERPDNYELVEHWQGKDISVASSPPQAAQCDGEILEIIPSRVKVLPAATKVLVPQKEK
ncbi:MAG: diacylglycerol kinase family protein [Candidatus Omnitrophota bacterium]